MSTILTNELGPFTGTDIAIASGKTITGAASQFKITGGTAGQFMKTDGSGGLSFDTIAAASGVMKKIHYFEETTRTSCNSTAGNQLTITSAFSPISTGNDLIVSVVIPGKSAGQNFMGWGLRFSAGGSNFDYINRGVGYSRGDPGAYMAFKTAQFQIPANDLTGSTFTVYYRTITNDSNLNMINPNSSDDARISTQTRTTLTIYEYSNP